MLKEIIVDEQDNPIGAKSWDERTYDDIYRVSAVWLTDLSGTYCLLTQRKHTKTNDPGKWMMAASGTVEEDETYDSNIVKEIAEEIGLTGIELKKCEKVFQDDGKNKFFVQFYSGVVDMKTAKVVIQEEEVEQYMWIEISELLKWLQDRPEDFVPSMKRSLEAVGAI
ncbi:NUDIX domain-containing protein [Candidatus Saccharibacteria bacterium]|nr:NUDIX domain-containing protein [Candidatus Saccharibacteria bacterium]